MVRRGASGVAAVSVCGVVLGVVLMSRLILVRVGGVLRLTGDLRGGCVPW